MPERGTQAWSGRAGGARARQASSSTPGPTDTVARLIVLGSAAAWSMRAGRASSSYLVELGRAALLLDIGQGAFAELAARRDPASLTAVLISHLHPDHCIDLVPLRHYLKYGREQQATVPVRGPSALRPRFDALTAEPGFLSTLPGPPLGPGTEALGPFEVAIHPVTHVGESYAFRVARGAEDPSGRGGDPPVADRPAGLVYSGDCGRPEDLLPLIRPGDTLLAEASYGPGPVVEGPNHLDAEGAARAARDGGAARLVLTHILDGMDRAAARRAARRVFAGPVIVARPGLTLEVG